MQPTVVVKAHSKFWTTDAEESAADLTQRQSAGPDAIYFPLPRWIVPVMDSDL